MGEEQHNKYPLLYIKGHMKKKKTKTPTMCKVQINYTEETADTAFSKGYIFFYSTLQTGRQSVISQQAFIGQKQHKHYGITQQGCSHKCQLLESSNSQSSAAAVFCPVSFGDK